MSSQLCQKLLGPADPSPVSVINPGGASTFLLIGDHAGNRVPQALGTLGVSEADRSRHIAWDIGVGALGAMLAETLDATFVQQTYSRLVIDCNRDPGSSEAVPEVSDHTPVPANRALEADMRAMRVEEIQQPYQAAIAAELARRDARGAATILVSLHSFTPAMAGIARPWDVGVLYSDGELWFARAVLAALRGRDRLVVGDNAPYAMDGTDHTVPRHCFARRRPYVELEIRQDQLETHDQRVGWSRTLGAILAEALHQRPQRGGGDGALCA